MQRFFRLSDGSVINQDGKIIFFSESRFASEICESGFCFICGTPPGDVDFNGEHVIPNWLLRQFGLHTKKITLPNNESVLYSKYRIPCCINCNHLMGKLIEQPIREIFSNGYRGVSEHKKKYGPSLFMNWMALIFIKCHLRDRTLRVIKDKRSHNHKISDLYYWQTLHHVHTVARSFYTGVRYRGGVPGSFLIIPSRSDDIFDKFDYHDFYPYQCMMIKIGDLALYAVFGDCCLSLDLINSILARITAPLNAFQVREIAAELALASASIDARPTFRYNFKNDTGISRITVQKLKHIRPLRTGYDLRGQIMHSIFRNFDFSNFTSRGQNGQAILEIIGTGRYSFLFDDLGNFIDKKYATGMPPDQS